MIEKVFVIILASISITLGLIMLITPGPGLLFIAIGLGILAALIHLPINEAAIQPKTATSTP